MSFLREPNAEVLPGYRLIEPLGSDTLVYGHLGANRTGARVAVRLHQSMTARTGASPCLQTSPMTSASSSWRGGGISICAVITT